jgi:hypothetical protein
MMHEMMTGPMGWGMGLGMLAVVTFFVSLWPLW